MFTHLIECDPKLGKRDELVMRMRGLLNSLQGEPGFVDLVGLRTDAEHGNVVYLSFWKTREEAEQYQRDSYNWIVNVARPFLRSTPRVELLQVDDSTIHGIVSGRAA